MTALASTNVTVSVSVRNRDIIPAGPKRVQIASVTFGDGALTYPTGGVPLPAIGVFGFNKAIEFGVIEQPINGFFYKFDRANHKILIYNQGVLTGSTSTGALANGAYAVNSAAAETVVRFSNTAASTAYDFGPLREMAAAIAPASATMLLLLFGE
jgi:hypothetical protein